MKKSVENQPAMGKNESSPSGADNTEGALTRRAAKDSDDMADPDSTPGKSPAFQFYPNDFLSDPNVIVMSLQERGAYITLICLCWANPLPSNINRLARLCGVPVATFRKLWPALEVCFRPHPTEPDLLIHPRLERERAKQLAFRSEKSEAGKRGAAKRWQKDGTAIAQPSSKNGTAIDLPMANDSSSSSSSDFNLQSSGFSQKPAVVGGTDARSKRPIFKGQRLTVFEWMLDDLSRLLGRHTQDFDLHGWFYTLDQQMVDSDTLIPQRDGGRWLHDRTMEEAARRGLPVTAAASHNPKTAGNLAAAARFVARGRQ